MMMTASILDDQAVLEQANAAQLQASKAAARGGAGAIDAALSAAEALDNGGRGATHPLHLCNIQLRVWQSGT